jgi:hypothetical protein
MMSRRSFALLLALLVIPVACNEGGKSGAPADPASAKAGTEAAPAADPSPPAEANPPADASAPAEPSSTASAADAAPATVDPTSVVGHYAFDWLHPRGARCKKVDDKMARKLADKKATCVRQDEDRSFAESGGEWVRCRAGSSEWMIFADQTICKDQLGTMEANAP